MIVIEAVFATSQKVDRLQLAIHPETGLIEDFGNLGVPSHKTQQFHDHCLAFAGMGDVHIHAREDVSGQHTHKEDFVSAGLAALNGGVTHLCDMPNNPTPPIDDQSYQAKLALTPRAPVPYLLYAGVGPETKPLSVRVPYKVYMGPSIGELFFRDDQSLNTALQRYRGMDVSFHCEDPQELQKYAQAAAHHQKRPVGCEVMATEKALQLITELKLKGKLCHYSAGEGLPLIRKARAAGAEVLCEVTPQHLYYSQERLSEAQRQAFQMNPPIRDEVDREKMLEAARNGEIDLLATDHAPHTPEEKFKGTSGLTGLDSYGPFVTWLLREQGFTPERVALMAAENPGRFVNAFLPALADWHEPYRKLGKGFGFLQPGFVGNVTLLNLRAPLTLGLEHLRTKARSNPFLGVTFPGRVEKVFIKGYPCN